MVSKSNHKTRTLILIMSVLFAVGLLISRRYYQSVNKSIDPRVMPAREMYKHYNEIASQGDYESLFLLLDSIDSVYTAIPHYQESYELGVLYNNKAAALLTIAIYKDSVRIPSRYFDALPKDTLLNKAMKAVERSIEIYKNWLHLYEDKTIPQLEQLSKTEFFIGLENYTKQERERFFKNRIQELVTAQTETPRRLSVSYSNMGLIYRNYTEYEKAATYYTKAISLWEDNLEARNNLNRLLGRPLEKHNLIQKLFPKDKDTQTSE